jgi:hypothetical protein
MGGADGVVEVAGSPCAGSGSGHGVDDGLYVGDGGDGAIRSLNLGSGGRPGGVGDSLLESRADGLLRNYLGFT